MNILIRDTDPEHAEKLKEFCLKFLFIENKEGDIFILGEPEETKKVLESLEVAGIFFLDVEYGLWEIVEKIRERSEQEYIILMGETGEKILESITPETRPSGTLIKPVQEEKIKNILQELWKDYENISEDSKKFRFQIKSMVYVLPCEKILCFESTGKKIRVCTCGQEFVFYDSLSRIEKELPDNFVRVHKSYVVNVDKIKSVNYAEMEVELEGDMYAYVSRRYKEALKEHLKGKA